MSIFRKKETPVTEEHPHLGDRGSEAQIEFFVSREQEPDLARLRALSPETQGLLHGFYHTLGKAALKKNRRKTVDAWKQAIEHIKEIEFVNQQVFGSPSEFSHLVNEQKETFARVAAKIFGKEKIITISGEPAISSRTGGIRWAINQTLMVLASPQKKEIQQTQKLVAGSTRLSETRIETKIELDPKLFDDYIQATWQGIIIHNPDMGNDRLLIPWSETNTLAFESDAALLIDPINKIIRPLNKKWAQSSWQPFGILRIRDRGNGGILVNVLMVKPDDFAKKIETLKRQMIKTAVSTKELVAREPVFLKDFVMAIPPQIKEEVLGLIAEENSRRKPLGKSRQNPNDSEQTVFEDGGIIRGKVVTSEEMANILKIFYEERQEEPNETLAHPLLLLMEKFFIAEEVKSKLPPKVRKALDKLNKKRK